MDRFAILSLIWLMSFLSGMVLQICYAENRMFGLCENRGGYIVHTQQNDYSCVIPDAPISITYRPGEPVVSPIVNSLAGCSVPGEMVIDGSTGRRWLCDSNRIWR